VIENLRRLNRITKIAISLGVLLLLAALSGCQTFSFYGQAIRGQISLIRSEESSAKLIADPKTPADLKEKLELVDQLRAFADKDLKLPVDGHYRKYADLNRPFVVWNVEAAKRSEEIWRKT
jgi:predicted aminopeptidase